MAAASLLPPTVQKSSSRRPGYERRHLELLVSSGLRVCAGAMGGGA